MQLRHLVLATAATSLVSTSDAAFHFMQIEQLIGGVNGNTSAQAITLRMRSGGQIFLAGARLIAWDSAGLNPVTLFDFTDTFLGPNSGAGAHLLLTTPAFNAGMQTASPLFAADFTLTNPIPSSYLSGGRVTFSDDSGTVHYWMLAYGNYTGSTIGDTTNDGDGNFGPAFGTAPPTNTRQGIVINIPAANASTTNAANYVLTANPASVINNANQSFTVVPEPGSAALVIFGAMALGGSIFSRRRYRGQR